MPNILFCKYIAFLSFHNGLLFILSLLSVFFTLGGNAALNEVPHWGRFRESLLWSGSKARKGGTKLRLTTLFMHVLARCPDKADYFHKVTKAIWFSAAFRHIFQNTGSAKHVGILVSFSWMCLNVKAMFSVGLKRTSLSSSHWAKSFIYFISILFPNQRFGGGCKFRYKWHTHDHPY